MGNIVVLTGSMRKGGNTDLLAQAFAEGAGNSNIVEIVSVADYKVNPCIGCNSCFTREGNQCFQKDDMTEIYTKLKVADIVVVASPVYFYGISAELKAIIDRLHTPMRNEFRVKKLALLLVGAATLPELFDAIKLQYQLVLNFFHLDNAGMVLVRGVKDIGDIKGTRALEEAYHLGMTINDETHSLVKSTKEISSNLELLDHLDELHTTDLGNVRIKRNLSLDTADVVAWCKEIIRSAHAVITRKGKNWYISVDDIVITVNAHSYTIITAHREKR
ncbi:MAG: DUF3781 domain-containing protein [Lachnospiraceae bacterium]|jgi:multimeric flavodoxin WrbA|nr:DUF3781 domain-containing protein [Lachnospiraceae bacterium]